MNFRTRNYKHEICVDDSPRSVLNYTDEVWETLCGRIAEHEFNGLVLYPGLHPFEYILDYKGFEDVASQPASRRRAIRQAVGRGLAIAHRHGLKTFMQHYVGHFTAPLANKYHIRSLANVQHAEVDRYIRYCYREIFRQLPELDGLYFNFESSPNAWQHVLDTAIREFNRMPSPPIVVFRLWEFTTIEGMRRMLSAYKGRVILAHKIADTSDTYNLPVADSRVVEWKRHFPGMEWMFIVGPCHNCGTNLCNQVWGDYDFVQSMLADARAKGADSISFHSINEFFCDGLGVFGAHEQRMAHFNRMHLEAAVDFVRGTRKTPTQRAAVLAGQAGCPKRAGMALLQAIEASSKIILLVYQQRANGASAEGYLNRGQFSHIFDPFFYYPATELNHQALKPQWNVPRSDFSWLVKNRDSIVTRDGSFQYIIDYVDPSKRKASFHPGRVAAALRRNVERSLAALRRYRRLAGASLAGQLEPYILANAAAGDFARHEILGAIEAYSGYFSRSRRALQIRLRRGVAEMKKAQAIVGSGGSTFEEIKRVFVFKRGPDLSHEIEVLTRALRHLGGDVFPFDALAAYLSSRRLYNDIRRWIRPTRMYDPKVIQQAGKQIELAESPALEALTRLEQTNRSALATNVRNWLDFLRSQRAETSPPSARCPPAMGNEFLPLVHHHCFRRGESFADDFLSFFEPLPARPASRLGFRVWWTKRQLMVCLREDGISAAERAALWETNADDPGSLSCVTRLFIDADQQSKSWDTIIVWPKGDLVGLNRRPDVKVATEFSGDKTHWQVTLAIPFSLIGRRPVAGDVWGFNITANPSVSAHREFTWAAQYDAVNPKLFGKLKFVD